MESDQAVREVVAAVSADAFKLVMGSVCAPVTVVTAFDQHRPHGTTVSAFCSLSLSPPMVMLALDRGSDLLALVRLEARFGINVLGETQATVAGQFARKGHDKFDEVEWVARSGAPHLADSACWFACDVEQLVPGGDHVVVLAAVVDATCADHPPLTYHRRAFGTHTPSGGRST